MRTTVYGSLLLAAGMLVTTATSFELLDRSPTFVPALRWIVLVGGLAATASLALLGSGGPVVRRAVATLGVVVALAGPAAYSIQTVTTAQSGSTSTAWASAAGATNGTGGRGGFGGGAPIGAQPSAREGLPEDQLATGNAVMAIGGFNAGDNSPTLARFQADVAAGRIHYYLADGGGGPDGQGSAAQIAAWVAAHYTTTTVGGVTVYDLTA